MLWLRRGRHLLGIIQPAVSKLIRHLLPWCSIRAGINGFWGWNVQFASPMAWQGVRDGEHKVQARPSAEEERQKLSANHVSTRHSWQVLSCIWGAVCNVKKTVISMVFRLRWKKKYFYFHFLIPIQLCIFFLYLISRVKLTFKCVKLISDVNGKPFPWSQSGLYVSIPD